MWDEVRRQLRHLDWDTAPPAGDGLLAEWSATVTALQAVRQAIAPIASHDDPFALLGTATSGAVRASVGTDARSVASLERVRAALNQAALTIAGAPPADRDPHLTNVTHTAYELAHRTRIQCTDDRVRDWLLAGETALDGAIHAPAPRTPTSTGLASWQNALAAVQHHPDEPVLRRGLALGHSRILHVAHHAVADAVNIGALPAAFSRAVQASLRELESAHQVTLSTTDGPARHPSRAQQAVMLQLGTAVRQLTGRPGPHENPGSRIDALLRSGIGQAALVAGLTADPDARAPADRLQRLALEYLANPQMLQRSPVPPTSSGAPTPTPHRTIPASPPSTRGPLVATIMPGIVLDSDTVVALCRARDVGVAASVADTARPPAILLGTDPADWPRLATAGQQAVADLVASVTPMVYALTRHELNREDLRGEMFVHLMRVAHAYEPERTNATRWPKYAWETLQHLRWRGVDNAGVPRQRGAQPPRMIGLDGTDPVSRDARPEDLVVGQAAVEATMAAVNALPTRLREPLLLSIAGNPFQQIGDELGISSATAHRRIAVARRILHRELGIGGKDDELRRRVPNPSTAETQGASSAAPTPMWETVQSLPRRSAPGIGPASSGRAPGIGW